MRPRYIVIEGANGAGKSTVASALVEHLRHLHTDGDGRAVCAVTAPSTETAVGRLVSAAFLGKEAVHLRAMSYLMLADAVERDDYARAMMDLGYVVVSDRHTLVSGLAYQAEVYSVTDVIAMQVRHQFLQPDVTIILDVPADVAEERIIVRAKLRNGVFEVKDPAYQERLRQRYLAYAAMFTNVYVLNGERAVDELVRSIMKIMETHR